MWEIACAKIVRERKMQTHVCIQNYMSYMINKMQLFPTKHIHMRFPCCCALVCLEIRVELQQNECQKNYSCNRKSKTILKTF